METRAGWRMDGQSIQLCMETDTSSATESHCVHGLGFLIIIQKWNNLTHWQLVRISIIIPEAVSSTKNSLQVAKMENDFPHLFTWYNAFNYVLCNYTQFDVYLISSDV